MLKTSTIVGEFDHLEVELIENFPVAVKELSAATDKDPEIRRLVECLKYGRKCEASDCFNINPTEFSLQQGCLLSGVRVFIPSILRSKILK